MERREGERRIVRGGNGAGHIPIRRAARLDDLPHAGTMFADSAESSNNPIRAPHSMRGAILPALAIVRVVYGMNPPVELQTAARSGTGLRFMLRSPVTWSRSCR